MARPPPPGCVLPPRRRIPPSPPPTPVPRRLAYNHPVAVGSRFERETSRASIFRVKDGATDAIGPRRGLPRRVVESSIASPSYEKSAKPTPDKLQAPPRHLPTYPNSPDTPSDNLQLSRPPRPLSLVIPLCLLPSPPGSHRARQRVPSFRLPPTPSNLSTRPVPTNDAHPNQSSYRAARNNYPVTLEA